MQTAVTREQVASVVTGALVQFGIEEDQISLDARLEELDMDSLDVIELGQIVKEEFRVELAPEEVKDLGTIGEVVDLIAKRAG